MVSRLDGTKPNRLKHWCFYLVENSNGLLETDWLTPIMCINIGVLFGIIGVVRVWCDIMVSAADNINNCGRCEIAMARFQDMTV